MKSARARAPRTTVGPDLEIRVNGSFKSTPDVLEVPFRTWARRTYTRDNYPPSTLSPKLRKVVFG
jgi:hypothetical protein